MGCIKEFVRIQNSKEFDFVYKRADKRWHTPYFVLFYKSSTERKVGFVASKKVGNAVYRNRAKRLLRAHFIHYSHQLKHGQYILVAKAPILKKDFSEVDKSFKDVLKKSKLFISTQ